VAIIIVVVVVVVVVLCSAQLKIFVDGLFHLNNDLSQFKEHLRDFLIQIKASRRRLL